MAVGWGHTALITAHHRELILTGRPHDFSALLRLRRLPEWLRQYSVRQTLELTQHSDDGDGNKRYDITSPTQLVGGMVNWLSSLTSSSSEQQPDWDMAQQQSVLPSLTPIKGLLGNDVPAAVACSAGFTAVISQDGHLYTFGLNGYSQCGIGRTSNNVWQPMRVLTTGLSAQTPVTAVALGFQHAICLDGDRQLYCWGKGECRQLGQRVTMSEAPTPLLVEQAISLVDASSWPDDIERVKPSFQPIGSKVTQIAAGMLHSTALTEDHRVLIWGKHILLAILEIGLGNLGDRLAGWQCDDGSSQTHQRDACSGVP